MATSTTNQSDTGLQTNFRDDFQDGGELEATPNPTLTDVNSPQKSALASHMLTALTARGTKDDDDDDSDSEDGAPTANFPVSAQDSLCIWFGFGVWDGAVLCYFGEFALK